MKSPRAYDVAIYTPGATPLYLGSPTPTGGGELQTFYLARALAAHGLRVCHIVLAHEALPEQRDGVDLIQMDIHNRTPMPYTAGAWRALGQADAQVYVQRMASYETGLLAVHARLRRRRFVYSIASN